MFECTVESNNNNFIERLFLNKSVAIGYNIVENPGYENLNLKKDGYIKFFGEDCVEWFINELLDLEGNLKNCFKNENEINLDTIPNNYDQNTCWFCEKGFKLEDVKENSVVKDHFHLPCIFRGLSHKNCNQNTRKAHFSFVPVVFCNFSGYDCHKFCEKLVNMATEKKTLKLMRVRS